MMPAMRPKGGTPAARRSAASAAQKRLFVAAQDRADHGCSGW